MSNNVEWARVVLVDYYYPSSVYGSWPESDPEDPATRASVYLLRRTDPRKVLAMLHAYIEASVPSGRNPDLPGELFLPGLRWLCSRLGDPDDGCEVNWL